MWRTRRILISSFSKVNIKAILKLKGQSEGGPALVQFSTIVSVWVFQGNEKEGRQVGGVWKKLRQQIKFFTPIHLIEPQLTELLMTI